LADPRILNIRELGDMPGRWRMGTWPDDVRRIDRLTPYGNPFKIGAPLLNSSLVTVGLGAPVLILSREASIALFRVYAEARIAREPDWLDPLRGMRLACWCAPLACHGEVILEVLDARA
jgi:hypothetical protein